MGVALGLAELRVAEDLLDDADVRALFQQERGGCVTGVMNTRGAHLTFVEQGSPVFPIIMGVNRAAGRSAEDQVPVLPGWSRGEVFGVLLPPPLAELSGQRPRKGEYAEWLV